MASPSEPYGPHDHLHAKVPGAGRFRNVVPGVAPVSSRRSAGTPIPVAVPISRAAWPATIATALPAPPMVLAVGPAKTRIARQRRRSRSSACGLLAVGAGLTALALALAYSAWSAKGDLAGSWNREPSNPAAMSSPALPLVPPPDTVSVAEDALLAAGDQLEVLIAPTAAADSDARIRAASLDSPGLCLESQDAFGAASGNQEFTADAWVAQFADRGIQDLDPSPCEPSETLPSLLETTLGKLGNNLLLQSQADSRLGGIRKGADGGRAQVSEPVASEDLGIFSRPPASFDYRRLYPLEDAVRPAGPGS